MRAWRIIVLGVLWCSSRAQALQEGERLVGRWAMRDGTPTATYAGSMAVFHFQHSGRIRADFTVIDSKGDQPLVVSVTVDGGKPVRLGLARGVHVGVVLARGLSEAPHLVTVRKEGEPWFGALSLSHPTLDVAGRWLPVATGRPVIEVIGDSDATGICVLGPDSPADGDSIRHSDWAAESLSWVGLLEAGLAANGHPADVVDLAISGSNTQSEADTYDDTAPGYDAEKFTGYAGGVQSAALVFIWGGGNDRHGGGDPATATPVTVAALSPYQKGVFEQLHKIFARNPGVKVVLLEYTDPAIPNWRPALEQVQSLLTEEERRRLYFLRVYDPTGTQDACTADPRGHPNLYLHSAWAAQILTWMMSRELTREFGFPPGEQWNEP